MKNKTLNTAALSLWTVKAGVTGLLVLTFQKLKFTHKFLNKIETLVWSESEVGRPYGYSLRTAIQLTEDNGQLEEVPEAEPKKSSENQVEWDSLIDKSFFARHLPPRSISDAEKSDPQVFPTILALTALFERPSSTIGNQHKEVMKKGRGNLLFMSFAQWLTDGVLRSSYTDRRKTDSSHQIDLAQIYGGRDIETKQLRENKGGRLKLDKKDYIPRLYGKAKNDYNNMSYFGKEIDQAVNLVSDSIAADDSSELDIEDYRNSLRATGLKTGTLSVGNLMMSTLFAREHNRNCKELLKVYPSLTDEQTFQYARNITIVRALQIILKDYIGFITGKDHYRLDPTLSTKMKRNGGWIPVEFNLLYRWHSSVPSRFSIDEKTELDWKTGISEFEKYGLDKLVTEAAFQSCGDISLQNTPAFLMPAEAKMILMSRSWKVRSYADYCRAFQVPVPKSFFELTDDIEIANSLNRLYGYEGIENLEFVIGIFAEKKYSDCLFGKLLMRMVAYDAFNHVYSNPILAPNNFTEESFTKAGLEWLNSPFDLDDLIKNNTGLKASPLRFNFRSNRNERLKKYDYQYDIEGHRSSQIEKTLCPILRIGENSGEVKLDNDGWASSQNLKNFMTNLGFKRGSIITSFIVYLAEQATRNGGPRGRVKLTSFHGTFQDHGSSSRIQHGKSKVDSARLQDLLSNVSNDGFFSQRELAKATLMFHQNATENGGSPSIFGAAFQLLEMGSLLRILGRKRNNEKGYSLTREELLSIWQNNQYPANNNCPHVVNKKPYGTFEAIGIQITMIYYFVGAWITQKRST